MRAAGAAVLALALAGCGGTYDAFCEKAMDCMHGNDADLEACEIDHEAQEDVASVYGCDAEWEAYFLCLEEKSICQGGDFWGPGNQCDGQSRDLDECLDRA